VFRPNAAAGTGQEHVAYRDANGIIWDCWYDPADGPSGTWKRQTINTSSHPAVSGPVIWTSTASLNAGVYDQAQHFAFVEQTTGAIWDSFYDGSWHLLQINSNTNANSPSAVGGLSACVLFDEYQANQQHVVYRAAGGAIFDCWFDVTTNTWSSIPVNLGVATSGPPAVGDPFVWVWVGSDGDQQLHVTYRAAEGVIWDCLLGSAPRAARRPRRTLGSSFQLGSAHEVLAIVEDVHVQRPEHAGCSLHRGRDVDAAGPAHDEVGDAESEAVAQESPLASGDAQTPLRVRRGARSVLAAEGTLARAQRECRRIESGLELDADVAAVAAASERCHGPLGSYHGTEYQDWRVSGASPTGYPGGRCSTSPRPW
jgi:hypothetical protein